MLNRLGVDQPRDPRQVRISIVYAADSYRLLVNEYTQVLADDLASACTVADARRHHRICPQFAEYPFLVEPDALVWMVIAASRAQYMGSSAPQRGAEMSAAR